MNFDEEIMQLMRETKYLRRMGIEVPEARRWCCSRRKSSRRTTANSRAEGYDRV